MTEISRRQSSLLSRHSKSLPTLIPVSAKPPRVPWRLRPSVRSWPGAAGSPTLGWNSSTPSGSFRSEIVADADPGLREAPQSALAFAAVGAVLARRGRLTDARLELEHALRLRRRQVGISPWATMEILLRLAPLLLDIGDRPGAAALFGEARNILTSLPDGAEAQLTRLERLEQRVATRQSRTIPPAASLTTREVVVLRLLRGTLSLGEIGRELQLSQNTIKTHTQAIYRKLSVSTRHGAVAKGHEIGIS